MVVRKIAVPWLCLGSGLLGLLAPVSSQGADGSIALYDYALNHNGSITGYGMPLPDGGIFDVASGLGRFEYTIRDPGLHAVVFWLDHEMSEPINSYNNEIGDVSAVGAPSGLTWEIDTPANISGGIFEHVLTDQLDNSVATAAPSDVSMALGWRFSLNEGEEALVRFSVSELEPDGFYLTHFDPDSGERIYFDGAVTISAAVPELGGQAVLGAIALLGVASVRYRQRLKRGGYRSRGVPQGPGK